MPKSELIISENLSKSFGDNHALVDFSLSVKQGEISGIVKKLKQTQKIIKKINDKKTMINC